MWGRHGHRIQNKQNNEKVLEVEGSNAEPGATVRCAIWNGGQNQKWDFPKTEKSSSRLAKQK